MMEQRKEKNQWVEDTLTSLDNVQRATPPPYLLTRIQQRLNNKNASFWEKASWLIGSPSIAVPGLAMLLVINISVIVFNNDKTYSSVTEQVANDDFAVTVATIYEIENLEP